MMSLSDSRIYERVEEGEEASNVRETDIVIVTVLASSSRVADMTDIR